MYWIYIGGPELVNRPLIGSETVEAQWNKLHPRQVGTFESFKERIEAGEMFCCHAALVWKGELNPVIGTPEFKAKEEEARKNRFKRE